MHHTDIVVVVKLTIRLIFQEPLFDFIDTFL